MKAKIRKIMTVVDETLTEMGRDVSPPVKRAATVAVIENPFAGKYVEDLGPLIDIGEELGGHGVVHVRSRLPACRWTAGLPARRLPARRSARSLASRRR